MATWARTVHDFANGETVTDTLLDALPKGAQLIADNDADVGSITGTMTTVCSHSFTALTARRFRIEYNLDVVSTVANDQIQARVLVDGATAIATGRIVLGVSGNNGQSTLHRSLIINLASGARTLALQCAREAGSGTVTAKANSSLYVTDISTFS